MSFTGHGKQGRLIARQLGNQEESRAAEPQASVRVRLGSRLGTSVCVVTGTMARDWKKECQGQSEQSLIHNREDALGEDRLQVRGETCTKCLCPRAVSDYVRSQQGDEGLFPLACALKSFGVSHLRVHGLCMGTIGQRRVSLFNSHPPWLPLPSFSVCVCMCGSVVMYVVCLCKCSGALVCGGRRRILSVLYHNLPFCRDTEHKPHCLPTVLLDSAGVNSTGDHTRLFTCVLEI